MKDGHERFGASGSRIARPAPARACRGSGHHGRWNRLSAADGRRRRQGRPHAGDAAAWAMSAGFVRGVGFVPRAAAWRWLFSAWACALALVLAGAARLMQRRSSNIKYPWPATVCWSSAMSVCAPWRPQACRRLPELPVARPPVLRRPAGGRCLPLPAPAGAARGPVAQCDPLGLHLARRNPAVQCPLPTLSLPSVQVNMRAGRLPPPEDNGVRCLEIPLNAV
jgi:hypothetical protein